MQILPLYKTCILDYLYKNATLFKQFRHIRLLYWYGKWRGHFYTKKREMVLVLDTSAQAITVKNSTIPHADTRLDLLTSWTILDAEVVRY